MTEQLIIASDTRLAQYGKAVKEGLELSSGARSTSTYYHSKDKQIAAIRKKVDELYNVDKAIPLLLASLDDSTFFFRQEVLRKELSSGFYNGPQGIVRPSVWIDDRMQESMVSHILGSLPFTYVLRLFGSFKESSINNRRTGRKILSWVIANLNDFSVVKYRTKIRAALIHALGERSYSGMMKNIEKALKNQPHDAQGLNRTIYKYSQKPTEVVDKLLMFVDGRGQAEWYSRMKYTKAYFQACKARTENTFFKYAELLDVSVARGIISSYPNSLFDQFKDSDGNILDTIKGRLLTTSKVMSDDQKVRTKKLQQKTAGAVRTDVDYSKVQTESLYKTDGVADQRAKRATDDKIKLPYKSIGIIKDVSLSNRGGKDSKGTPRAVIEHLTATLKASCSETAVAETPVSQTDLSGPFIKIIKENPDVEAIFVLSDGYENYPYEGCFNDLVERYNKKNSVQVIHCSPYVSAEKKAQSRSLGGNIISMAITKPSQISTQMETRLLDFNPRAFFDAQFSKYLDVPEIIQVEEEIIL